MKTESSPHSRLTLAQRQGQAAEDQALAFLQQKGLCLVAKNIRFRVGEIDLVMRDRAVVVFVEVRFRRSSRFGGPAETVGYQKQQRVRRAASLWLVQACLMGRAPCRFDVVAITADRLEWIVGAF
jgi:putative endonuclease